MSDEKVVEEAVVSKGFKKDKHWKGLGYVAGIACSAKVDAFGNACFQLAEKKKVVVPGFADRYDVRNQYTKIFRDNIDLLIEKLEEAKLVLDDFASAK